MSSSEEMKTTDLVEEWNKVYTNEIITNKNLSEQDRRDIINYVAKNKDELTIVLSSLTEAMRLKNGDSLTKELFLATLHWIHKRVWASIIMGVKSNSNFRKSYDLYSETENEVMKNPDQAIAKYKEIFGEDDS